MPFYRKKYFAHAVVLCSMPVIFLMGSMPKMGILGAPVGGAVGAFYHDPLISAACVLIGAAWSGTNRKLIFSLVIVNVAYRLVWSAKNIMQYSNEMDVTVFDPNLFLLLASCWGALILGYASNSLVKLIPFLMKKPDLEGQA
jgi:hypothetical protein